MKINFLSKYIQFVFCEVVLRFHFRPSMMARFSLFKKQYAENKVLFNSSQLVINLLYNIYTLIEAQVLVSIDFKILQMNSSFYLGIKM